MGKRIQISRQVLYDKIWSMPVSRVAKEYHLSDVGLAKICRRHQIPRPSVGYWAQIQHGQTPRKLILPPATDDQLDIVEITINDMPPLPTDPAFKARAEVEMAAVEEPEFQILVQESLDQPHPMVQIAIKSFQSAEAHESGILVPKIPQTLDIRVTPLCLQRALRVWNTLIPALELLGYKTQVQQQLPHATVVTVLEETVPIYIFEEVDCRVRDATAEEQARWRRQKRYETKVNEYSPTGRLCLKIEVPNGFGLRQRWSDTARAKVETRLVGFVHGLIDMAVHLRADRIEREERERKWEEESLSREDRRKQYKVEKERFDNLIKDVDAWHLSQKLRAFAEALRAKELQASGRIDSDTTAFKRIEWIVQQADRLDPLKETPPSVLDEPEPSWW